MARSRRATCEFLGKIPTPQPAGQLRLYAGKIQDSLASFGTSGWIQYYDTLEVPADGMSLTQLNSLCRGTNSATTLEAIELGIQKLPSQYADSNLHLFTYFRTAGNATGNYVGGYNSAIAGFVPCLTACTASGGAAPYGPGATVPAPSPGNWQERRAFLSVSGGSSQWWMLDWVNASSYVWLGYYPIGTPTPNINFDLINAAACETDWYAEAYDPTPGPVPTNTWNNEDMGNGTLGTDLSTPNFHGMLNWTSATTTANFSTFASEMGPIDGACYATSAIFTGSATDWKRYFHYGGPGGNGAGCD